MIFFRRAIKRNLFPWVLLLSVALLCAQGVKLHVHSIDHAHNQQYGHITIDAAAEHSHRSELHLSHDVSHVDHHDEVVSELDVSPDGLLKKVSSKVVMLVLLATLLSLFLFGFFQQILQRYRDGDAILPWRYLFSPPLRAPPL
jgi:hypothetical protein